MNRLTTFLVSTSAVTFLSFTILWYQNRKKRAALLAEERKIIEDILSSPATAWKKVGRVKEILYYPLKSGKGKSIKHCNFDKYGISVNEPGVLLLKDRMFIVYDEKTGKFQTGRQIPKILLITIDAIDEGRVKLEAPDMPTLVLDLSDSNAKDKCTMWYGELVQCLDCGPKASAWFSKYLTGSDSGLKLGMFVPKSHRNLKEAWKGYAKLYNNLRNEDAGIFSDLASYMIMSEASVGDLNKRLQKPIQPLQLRPNIIVEGCDQPYAEDLWEWVKIGDEAIVHNFKLCTRCTMVRIDPDTGIPDPQSEPLRTLRTYRRLKDPELDALEDHAPAIGVYCGLYRAGQVQQGDDIFVYQPT